ncbi:recombination protein NinG, partial [Xenorhabdus bovienii]
MAKAKTPKTCKICLTEFTSYRSTQKVCSVPCSIKFAAIEARRKAEKALHRQQSIERQELKARKEKLKSQSDWEKEAQAAFNKYIRA